MRTNVDSVIATEPAATSVQEKEMQPRSAAATPVGAPALDTVAAGKKLTLLRKMGLFGADTKGAVVERASTAEDLAKAYRLVHQVYLESGYIKPEPSGLRLRIFETSSETATFVAKVKGEVVGVISVVGDSIDLGLPSDLAFSDELDEMRDRGFTMCEVTNQVVADGYRKSAVTTELMRVAVAHAIQAGFRIGVATVSPSHNGFYDLLGFAQLGAERSYSDKVHDPVVALTIDFDHYRNPPENLVPASHFVHAFLGPKNPYLGCVAAWDRRARAKFLNPELLEQLFVSDSQFLARCTPEELDRVKLRWGLELYLAVIGSSSLAENENEAVGSTMSAAPFSSPSTVSPFGMSRGIRRARRDLRSHAQPQQSAAPWWPWLRSLVPSNDLALGI